MRVVALFSSITYAATLVLAASLAGVPSPVQDGSEAEVTSLAQSFSIRIGVNDSDILAWAGDVTSCQIVNIKVNLGPVSVATTRPSSVYV